MLFPNIATVNLLRESATQPKITPTQVILHTAVDAPGQTDLHNYFNRADIGTESHFFIQNDGTILQYMDTTTRADANHDANSRAISIETEDDGTIAPWTLAQVKAIKRLGEALMKAHSGILRRVAPAQDLPGWGYHSLYDSWNKNKHSCPGGPRIHQFQTDLTMWLRNPAMEIDDMPSIEDVEKVVRKVLDEGAGRGTSEGWDQTNRNMYANIQTLHTKVDRLQASVTASKVDVAELATLIAEKLDPENVSQAAVEAGLREVLGSLDEPGNE